MYDTDNFIEGKNTTKLNIREVYLVCSLILKLIHVPFANMEEVELMIYMEGGLQIMWLHLRQGVVLSFLFTIYDVTNCLY